MTPREEKIQTLLDGILAEHDLFSGAHLRQQAVAAWARGMFCVLFPGVFQGKALSRPQLRESMHDLEALIIAAGGDPGVMMQFFAQIPRLRELLYLDAQAAWDGDPAANDPAEIVACYPGLRAIAVQRMANFLWRCGVPLLPRMMTEYAHSATGIDIHPGAAIGKRFFIDHGTGVVIGETAVIGENVKLYQGVTLGGLSTRGGQSLRGKRRHPTLEDDVTVYANASILGGETVIGRGSVIGANVFLTQSVPAHTTVRSEPRQQII